MPTRYYVLVENVNASPNEPGGTLPTQVEVSVMVDSVNLVLPKHDHEAGDISTVGVGTFQAMLIIIHVPPKMPRTRFIIIPIVQNHSGISLPPPLLVMCGTGISVNGVNKYSNYEVQIFRQTIPGDSKFNGLKMGYTTVYDPATNLYFAECSKFRQAPTTCCFRAVAR